VTELLTPHELDAVLRFPRGKSAKLARAGKIPHLVLPNGEVRFDTVEVERFLREGAAVEALPFRVAHGEAQC
jgi:hypothetical protein